MCHTLSAERGGERMLHARIKWCKVLFFLWCAHTIHTRTILKLTQRLFPFWCVTSKWLNVIKKSTREFRAVDASERWWFTRTHPRVYVQISEQKCCYANNNSLLCISLLCCASLGPAQLSSARLSFVFRFLHGLLNGFQKQPHLWRQNTFHFGTVGNSSFACAHAITERERILERVIHKRFNFPTWAKTYCSSPTRQTYTHAYYVWENFNFNTKSLILNQEKRRKIEDRIVVEISSGFRAVNCNVFSAGKACPSTKHRKWKGFFWWKNSIKKVNFFLLLFRQE